MAASTGSHGSSAAPAAARSAANRENASASGRNGTLTPPATARPRRTTMSAAIASITNSRANRDLPMPASPSNTTTEPAPTRAASSAPRSALSSRSRPTTTGQSSSTTGTSLLCGPQDDEIGATGVERRGSAHRSPPRLPPEGRASPNRGGLRIADEVSHLIAAGDVDAVIHNAAIYVDDRRVTTPKGHAKTVAVNVIASYRAPRGSKARAGSSTPERHAILLLCRTAIDRRA